MIQPFFHSAVGLTYIAVLLFLTLMFAHPLYLLALILVTVLAIAAVDGLATWQGYMRPVLWMVVIIMLINPLVNHAGETIFWQSPAWPMIGTCTMTLEAIFYGAVMGIRLLEIISIFCLYNLIIQPDRLLNILSPWAHKSALVLSIATRMFIVLSASLHNIREVMQLRGVNFSTGSLKEQTKKYSYIFNVLLVSSLEDSLQIAEAMRARGFGSGPRTRYQKELWRPRDGLALVGCLLAIMVALYCWMKGIGIYTYFPQLDYLIKDRGTIIGLLIIMGGLSLPVFLSWGWQRCPYIKSKI